MDEKILTNSPKIPECFTGLIFCKVENKNLERFQKEHSKCIIKKKGVPIIKIAITPTGICDAIEIECQKCKKKENITHYDHW